MRPRTSAPRAGSALKVRFVDNDDTYARRRSAPACIVEVVVVTMNEMMCHDDHLEHMAWY
jgi:hypothetical protein